MLLESMAIAAVAAPDVPRRPEDQLALFFREICAPADGRDGRDQRADAGYL